MSVSEIMVTYKNILSFNEENQKYLDELRLTNKKIEESEEEIKKNIKYKQTELSELQKEYINIMEAYRSIIRSCNITN